MLSPESPIQHVNGQHRPETVTEEKDLVDRPGTGCRDDLVGRGIKPALELRIVVSDVRAREYPVVKGDLQIGPSSRAEIKSIRARTPAAMPTAIDPLVRAANSPA